jgi:hypothetical protein
MWVCNISLLRTISDSFIALNSPAIGVEFAQKEEQQKKAERKLREKQAKETANKNKNKDSKGKRKRTSPEPITPPTSIKKRIEKHSILEKFDAISTELGCMTVRTLRNKLIRMTKATSVNESERKAVLKTLNEELECIKRQEATMGAFLGECNPLSESGRRRSDMWEPERSQIIAMKDAMAELIVEINGL